jgi:hypothetical protein
LKLDRDQPRRICPLKLDWKSIQAHCASETGLGINPGAVCLDNWIGNRHRRITPRKLDWESAQVPRAPIQARRVIDLNCESVQARRASALDWESSQARCASELGWPTAPPARLSWLSMASATFLSAQSSASSVPAPSTTASAIRSISAWLAAIRGVGASAGSSNAFCRLFARRRATAILLVTVLLAVGVSGDPAVAPPDGRVAEPEFLGFFLSEWPRCGEVLHCCSPTDPVIK